MIDETLVSAVRDRLKKLLPYRRQVRPAIPASFPSFVDGELLRLDTTTRDIVGGLQALDPILEALTGDQGAAFPEAPIDGTPYARQDAGWTPVATIKGEPGEPGQPGEPGEPGRDGKDGQDGADGADFPDAPADGQLYARKDGDWTAFEPGTGEGGGGGGDGSSIDIKPTATGPGGHFTSAPKHPYWRLLVTANQRGDYLNLAELQFRTTPGTPQLATGGVATANSIYNADYNADKAFDGLASTCWHVGGGSTGWIAYAFPSPISVAQITIQTRAEANGVTGAPKDFQVQWSDDGVTWTTEWSVTGAVFTSLGEVQAFNSDAPPPTAYDRYPTHLAALNDVSMANPPQTGQVLAFGADGWKPAYVSPSGAGADLSVGTHTYWRIRALATTTGQGNYAVALAELQFRSISGGPNLATGGFALGVSNIANAEPYRAFDGSASTYWAHTSTNNSVGQYGESIVGYQFAKPVSIAEVSFQARSDAGNQTPTTWAIEYSDDNSTWTEVTRYTAQPVFANSETRAYPVPTRKTAATAASGGIDFKAPAILQSAYARASGGATATLAAKPTKGNAIIMIVSGFSSGKGFPAGFQALPRASASNNAIDAAWKTADGSEGTAFAVSGSDWCNLAVYEIEPFALMQTSVNSIGGSQAWGGAHAPLLSSETLSLFAAETDNTSDLTYNGSATHLESRVLNANGNHGGIVGAVRYSALSTIQGTISSSNNSVWATYSFVKKTGAITQDTEFAAVVFEGATASGGSTPIRILASKNVKAVTRLSAGRYRIDFAKPAAEVDRLIPSLGAWFAPYPNTSSVTMAVDRNSDQLDGMGLTASSCVITAMGTTGYDPRRITARFTEIIV